MYNPTPSQQSNKAVLEWNGYTRLFSVSLFKKCQSIDYKFPWEGQGSVSFCKLVNSKNP